MNNRQLKHLDKLEAEAAQLAASFYSRTLRADPGSDAAKRFKRLAEKANTRAERRYQASISSVSSERMEQEGRLISQPKKPIARRVIKGREVHRQTVSNPVFLTVERF